MADEQNKSKMPPTNGSAFGASEIEKIGQQAYIIPKSELEQRQRAATARVQIDALAEMPEDYVKGNKVLNRIAETAPNTLVSAQERVRSSVANRLERSNTQAQNVIGREYSEGSINSQIRQKFEDPQYQNKALAMMNTPHEALTKRREEISGQISNLGTQSSQAASQLFANRGVRQDMANQISGNAEQASNLVKELASIDLAMKTRRQTGSDPLSKFEKLNSTGKTAEEFLSAKSIGEELSKGGVNINKGGQSVQIENADIGKALAQEADNLRKALSELANSAGKSAEELEVMRKSAEESAENFEKLQKASSSSGGGGASGSQWASAAGGMFNAIGQGIQQIAVGQRLGQVSNIAGYAGIENQKYDMYKSGRSGNVLNQMLSSQWGESEAFGKQLKTGQQAAVAAFTAGGVAQTAAGGFQVAEGLGQKANPLAYATGASTQNTAAVLAGAQNTVQGLSTTAVNGMDLLRGVSTNAAAQQGIQTDMAARKELLKVSAEQMQGFRDFGVGMSTAAQGMGKRGGAFLESATSGKNLEAMVNSRLSPEQMAQMSQVGVQQMGSQFNQNQVFTARGLERSGMGSMGENMQRMTALAGAGSNNPQTGLASVLESAFSKSLDSSKAISAMVDNTAQMVSNSAGAAVGMDTVAAAASLTAAGVNEKNSNQEFAVQRAAQAAELSNKYGTNTDVSFSGMVNTARLSKQLGVSGEEAINLQQVDAATLKTLKGGTKEDQEKFLKNRGFNLDGKDASKIIGGALDYKANSILEAGGAGLAQGIDSDALRKKIQSGGKLTDKEQEQLGKTAIMGGYSGAEELISQVKGISSVPNKKAKADAATAIAGEGGSDSMKTWDNLRTSGFKQLSEQALQATKTMEKFGGALKVLVDMNDKLEKFGGAGGEAKFSDAAKVSAETFGKSTLQFEGAVSMFDKAIRETMGQAGLGKDDLRAAIEAQKLMKQGQTALNRKTK